MLGIGRGAAEVSVQGRSTYALLLVLIAVSTQAALSGKLLKFDVDHLDCALGDWTVGTTATWGGDDSLTVVLTTTETATDRVKQDSGYVEIEDDLIYLGYKTFDPYKTGEAAPACAFPVRMTYVISELPRKDYHFHYLRDPRSLRGWRVTLLVIPLALVGLWVVAKYLHILSRE